MATFQPFPAQESLVDIQSPEFEQARSQWKGVLQDFEERLKEVSSEGTVASCSRHQDRGQLLRASFHLILSISGIMIQLTLFHTHSEGSHCLTARL